MVKNCTSSEANRAGEKRLFIVRLWRETLSEGQEEWRGSLTYLLTGEVRYFRDVDSLYRALLAVLDCPSPKPPTSSPTSPAGPVP
jgi:hypothetical protein